MLTNLIHKLSQHNDLSTQECSAALQAIMQNSQEAAEFLTLLSEKGETADEIYGFVKKLREDMVPVDTNQATLDIVGTGGDGKHTVNISTASSLVAASLGMPVTKHGNRSVSSKCGSADVLEHLGIDINVKPNKVSSVLDRDNFVFLFAPNFHSNLAKVAKLRNQLKIRTIFNLLGPLLNPTNPKYYLLGVYKPELMQQYAHILPRIGTKKALVVHSIGLDEMSLIGPTQVFEIDQGKIKNYCITPKDVNLLPCELRDIQGDSAEANAKLLLKALSGESSAILDTIALNTGAAIYAAERCDTIAEGVKLAKHQLKSGNVMQYLRGMKHA